VTTFVDSSALFALLDADDVNHAPAARTFPSFATDGEALLTHSYVVLESSALAQHRIGLDAVRALVDDVLPAVDVQWVDEELHQAATAALLAAGRRGVSLVDWASFELMRRRGVTRAFTFDTHFAAHGFHPVP
jgi:predicted nucleic acid-binding protein